MSSNAATARRTIAPIVLVLMCAACGDDPVNPASLSPCRSETLAFAITGGTSPTISWSPNCRLNGLVVVHQGPTASEGPEWFIGVNGAVDAGLISPVRYGALPAGARQVSAPRPLVAGTTYRVLVGYTPPQPEPWTFSAVTNAFTLCGRSSGRCATDGMEYFIAPSPEGLRFDVVAARPSTARGDTARFVARVTNPGVSTVAWLGCGAAFLVLQRPGMRLDLPIGACAVGDSIFLAPSESRMTSRSLGSSRWAPGVTAASRRAAGTSPSARCCGTRDAASGARRRAGHSSNVPPPTVSAFSRDRGAGGLTARV